MRTLVILLASCLSLPVFAQISFSKAEVELVQLALQNKEPNVTTQQAKARLLENSFLLEQAKKRHSDILQRQSMVGFSTDYHTRRYTLSLLKARFKLPNISKLADKAWTPYSSKWLAENLPAYPSTNVYSPAQLTKMQEIDLSNLANGPLTLATLMQEQSMQNRYKLHQGDFQLFKTLVAEHRHFNLTMKKLEGKIHSQGLSRNRLTNIAKGELLRPVMQNYFGVVHSMHGERSEYIERLQQNITGNVVSDYFKANKESFKYIEKVQANAVQFANKDKAEHFRQVAATQGFEQATQHFNVQDLFANSQGLIKRQKQNSWAQQLAFSLRPKQLSKPIRTPKGQWLVAQTKQRFYAYYPIDSETVKYQAKLALTEAFARTAYEKLKTQWLTENGVVQ